MLQVVNVIRALPSQYSCSASSGAVVVLETVGFNRSFSCGKLASKVPVQGREETCLRQIRGRIRSCTFIASMASALCSSVYSLLLFFSPFSSTSSPSTTLPTSAVGSTALETATPTMYEEAICWGVFVVRLPSSASCCCSVTLIYVGPWIEGVIQKRYGGRALCLQYFAKLIRSSM